MPDRSQALVILIGTGMFYKRVNVTPNGVGDRILGCMSRQAFALNSNSALNHPRSVIIMAAVSQGA